MEKSLFNRITYITVGLTIIGIILILLTGAGLGMIEMLKRILSLFSAIVFFWTLYFSKGWKWPIIKHIAYKENINGTWFGTYESRNELDDKIFKGEIALIIRQSFLNINIVSYTNRYITISYGEAVLHDVKNGNDQLVYLYSQNLYKPTDDLSRKGASELQLLKEVNQKKLFGSFWTNHNSKGRLNLKMITSEHVSSFEDAKIKVNNN